VGFSVACAYLGSRQLTAAQRRSLRKEAEEWDRLSDEDWVRIFDEGTPRNAHFRRPLSKTLKLALDVKKQKQSRRVARRKQATKR
jgi:hypothetical protein